MITQAYYYECDECGKVEEQKFRVDLWFTAIRYSLPTGWRVFGSSIYCPKHKLVLKVEEVE